MGKGAISFLLVGLHYSSMPRTYMPDGNRLSAYGVAVLFEPDKPHSVVAKDGEAVRSSLPEFFHYLHMKTLEGAEDQGLRGGQEDVAGLRSMVDILSHKRDGYTAAMPRLDPATATDVQRTIGVIERFVEAARQRLQSENPPPAQA